MMLAVWRGAVVPSEVRFVDVRRLHARHIVLRRRRRGRHQRLRRQQRVGNVIECLRPALKVWVPFSRFAVKSLACVSEPDVRAVI